MAKEFASAFYGSPAWKECRDGYLRSVGGLCERCYANGKIVPAEIVHHKIHISQDNLTDERVLLDWNNLQCVCRECHAALHPENNRTVRRFTVDSDGRVHSREVREASVRGI